MKDHKGKWLGLWGKSLRIFVVGVVAVVVVVCCFLLRSFLGSYFL